MQIKKDYIRDQIAESAKVVFLEKGFVKTSMRDIARGAGVSVSNLYNYFDNKNELFRYIVTPLIMELNRMVREHHNIQYHAQFLQFACGESDDMIPEQMHTYLVLLNNHRDELRLLLFKAQGSSLENFIDEYTDDCTRQVVRFMDDFQRRYPQFSSVGTPFTYHIHMVWMFSFISEVMKHNLSPKEIEEAITDYMHFEYTGWRAIMNQKNTN